MKLTLNKTTLILMILASLIISMVGCGGGGGGGGGGTSTTAVVEGYVTQSQGGPALEGTSIEATTKSRGGTTKASTTTTDSNGRYSLSLASGTYDIVAQKNGYAASKVQDYYVLAGNTYKLSFIQKPVFYDGWAVQAPTINVSGISTNDTIASSVNIKITVTGANAIKLIEAHLGNRSGTADYSASDTDTLEFTYDPSQKPLPQENSYLYIVAYDVNNNRTERTIPFTTTMGTSSYLNAPADPKAYAYTFAKDLEILAKNVHTLKDKMGIPYDKNILELPNGEKLDLRSAPQDTTVAVVVTWEKVTNASGYQIYRKENDGSYEAIAVVEGESTTTYYDFDPRLTIGNTYTYKIYPFDSNGLGNYAETPSVKILNRFVVELVSPADNSTGVSTSPTFKWKVVSSAGSNQLYTVGVWGYNDTSYKWTKDVENTTSTSGATLDRNTVYAWDLIWCTGRDSWSDKYNEYMSYSWASPDYNSSNGFFTFTTQE